MHILIKKSAVESYTRKNVWGSTLLERYHCEIGWLLSLMHSVLSAISIYARVANSFPRGTINKLYAKNLWKLVPLLWAQLTHLLICYSKVLYKAGVILSKF